jgi:hypothetical protein
MQPAEHVAGDEAAVVEGDETGDESIDLQARSLRRVRGPTPG